MGKSYRKRGFKLDWTELWVGTFLTIYLLYAGPDGFTSVSKSKTVMFFIFMGLLLVIGLCLWIRDLNKKRLRCLTPAQIAALAFWAFTLLSAAFSPSGAKAWYDAAAHEAALTVSLYVLLFLIVSRWGMPTERLFRVFFCALAAFAVICVLQALRLNPLGLYPAGTNYYYILAVKNAGYAGTIGNVDLVSAFLALVIPILLIHTRGQKPGSAWPCWVLAAVCIFILFWIQVLNGIVGLAMGAAICLPVLCPDKWRKRILLAYGILGVSGLAVLWFFDLPVGFFHEIHEILHGRISESFGSGRLYIWRQMTERLWDRLWLGVGPDMARYSQLESFYRYDAMGNLIYKEMGRLFAAQLTDAHCYPLHILYCQGLPALLSWLGLVGIAISHWIKQREDRAVAILGGGLVCFLCAMLFNLCSICVMPFFWLTLALLEAKANQETVS